MLQSHMLRLSLLILLYTLTLGALEIVSMPIVFDAQRIALSKEYIRTHYGFRPKDITIEPKIIVLHYTAVDDLKRSFLRFKAPTLPIDRPDISAAGRLNVSAHFLVDQNGTVYKLMPSNIMARHVIGLNYSSIGIENVGGENFKANLTAKQIQSNIALIKKLIKTYPGISYLIGHSEYRCFENTPLWLERDPHYRTPKEDPGAYFLDAVRAAFPQLKKAPCP